jgi:hypothetical protein
MKTASVSSNAADSKMVKEVGERMVAALESYMAANNQKSTLSGLKWEFSQWKWKARDFI